MTSIFERARDKWPDDLTALPPHFQAVYQTWLPLRLQTLEETTAGATPVPSRTPGRYYKKHHARDLTLLGTPFPSTISNPPAVLNDAQLEDFVRHRNDETPIVPQVSPPAQQEFDKLRRDLASTQLALDQLLRQQDAREGSGTLTSSYQVADATLALIPPSVRDREPLSRFERRRLGRDHGGVYPKDALPKELHLPEDVRTDPKVTSHKTSLLSLQKEIINPLMAGNLDSLRMAGTTHSRLAELLAEVRDANASAESGQDTVVLPRDLLMELEPAVATAAASIELILDLHARMRVVVTSRVEKSLGFNDLHDDPNKSVKESFLSKDFQDKIEQRAKEKAHLAWAQSGKGNPPTGSLHGAPPTKKTGAGGNNRRRRGISTTRPGNGKSGNGRNSGKKEEGTDRGRPSNKK